MSVGATRLRTGAAAVLVAALAASASRAGTTRYYYDPSGRLLGAMQSQAMDRTSRVDQADNLTYLHVLPTIAPTAVDTLGPGGVLIADQGLTSADGRFGLTLQDDGNLVIYQNANGAALWASATNGHQPGYLTLQSDGNLVVYGPDDIGLWASGTNGDSNPRLVMQSDGNLVVFSGSTPVWSSGTGGH